MPPDGTELNPGTGGDLISTDEIAGGLKVQRVKVQFGDDGTALDVHSGAPLPVSLSTPLLVSVTKTAIAPSGPGAATVGIASAQAVAGNANRKGLILINTSNNIISLAFGASAAVLHSGITLFPGGAFTMSEYSFSTGAINAIASVASSNLAV